MKHSPAPWERFGDEIYAADGTRIAEAVTMADAPLLTRAPRLFAALSKLVELEDMRLRQLHEMGHGTDYADHHRLLPLAWAEAREALRPNARDNVPYTARTEYPKQDGAARRGGSR